MSNSNLTPEQSEALLKTLKNRFELNMNRHAGQSWNEIQRRLEAFPAKLRVLQEMEKTGGEPDVVSFDGQICFCDCSPESPKARRSFCYDNEALESRKENKPKDSAVRAAAEMGIELLTEDQYQQLQAVGEFDIKTSSWLKTPVEVRKFGGSIFGDRRFGRVFIYHNGAESYYASRGFRGLLRV